MPRIVTEEEINQLKSKSNEEIDLETELRRQILKQKKISNLHLKYLYKLKNLENKQQKKSFKVKLFVFKVLTFGCGDINKIKKKITNKIKCQKVALNNLNQFLEETRLKICALEKSLEETLKTIELIQKEIQETELYSYYNKKAVLEIELRQYNNGKEKMCNFHWNSLVKLESLENKQQKKSFKVKHFVFKVLTFGCCDIKKKITNKIECEKVVLDNQKKILEKIELKICDLERKLEEIFTKIQQKKFDEDNNITEIYSLTSKSRLLLVEAEINIQPQPVLKEPTPSSDSDSENQQFFSASDSESDWENIATQQSII